MGNDAAPLANKFCFQPKPFHKVGAKLFRHNICDKCSCSSVRSLRLKKFLCTADCTIFSKHKTGEFVWLPLAISIQVTPASELERCATMENRHNERMWLTWFMFYTYIVLSLRNMICEFYIWKVWAKLKRRTYANYICFAFAVKLGVRYDWCYMIRWKSVLACWSSNHFGEHVRFYWVFVSRHESNVNLSSHSIENENRKLSTQKNNRKRMQNEEQKRRWTKEKTVKIRRTLVLLDRLQWNYHNPANRNRNRSLFAIYHQNQAAARVTLSHVDDFVRMLTDWAANWASE